MITPKRITKEQAEAIKKKQQILRQAGYNIKVNGSWGPWQEEQYRKILSREKAKKIMSKQANVGVMALPVAGYGATQLLRGLGAAQLLEGLGSVSLPSISIPSASALTMAAPVALTLAGPAYDVYEHITGKHHKIQPLTREERLAQVFAPDATRVSRPIVPDATRQVKSGPIGERYINPILTRKATKNRYLTTEDEDEDDDITVKPFDDSSATPVFFPQNPENDDEDDEDDEDYEDEDNYQGNKNNTRRNSTSWFKLWEGSGTSGAPKHPNFWRHVRNFGVRVPLYTGVAAPAFDVVGNMVGASREPEGQVHQWKWPLTSNRFSLEKGAWKLFGDAYSTPVDSTKVEQPQAIMQSQQPSNSPQTVAPTVVTAPRDTINPEVQDSIIKAFFSR